MCFLFFLTEKKNIIRTHNSSRIILKELQGKSLDIYWVVSNLFCLSHFKFIFIPHSDPIVETIENNVSLFRNPLSLLCGIIGFRHYFGDPYLFSKWQQHTFLFFSFYGKIIRMIISLWYTLDRKSFMNLALDKFYFFFISNLFC